MNFEIIEVRAPGKQFFLGGAPEPVVKRIFSDQALNEHINRVLANLPEGKRAVEIDITGGPNGVHVVGAYQTSSGWTLVGGVYFDTNREFGGEIKISKVWD